MIFNSNKQVASGNYLSLILQIKNLSKTIALLIGLLSFHHAAYSQAFITTWKTDNAGYTTNNQIFIPLEASTTYNFTVNWGDGNSDTYNGLGSALNPIHTYAAIGTYTVSITGTFPHIYFNDIADKDKILTIEQWGNIAWASMEAAFYGCSNLTYTATDVPNLAGVTNMSRMFTNCINFDGNASMNNWNTSNITNMSYMFHFAYVFNQNIGNWNTGNVTDMSYMFNTAYVFNQDIGNWNTGNVIDMIGMFAGAFDFNQDIGNWNTSNLTSPGGMFSYATSFNQDISSWNTSVQ